MPLRDHFRPPVDEIASWESFHAGWPMVIVQQLRQLLPPGFIAAPRAHQGPTVEVDVATYELEPGTSRYLPDSAPNGTATAIWGAAEPSVAVETEIPDPAEYEVRIYDLKRGRKLVAAIEIASPANQDRPEHRNQFVAKCAKLLQESVAVSIIDLVTVRQANLYSELLQFIGQRDPSMGDPPEACYTAAMRWLRGEKRAFFQAWYQVLSVGQRLPVLPLWLTPTLALSLDLEVSYENTCHDLWIA